MMGGGGFFYGVGLNSSLMGGVLFYGLMLVLLMGLGGGMWGLCLGGRVMGGVMGGYVFFFVFNFFCCLRCVWCF